MSCSQRVIVAFWLAYILCLARASAAKMPASPADGTLGAWVQGTASFFGGPADTKSNSYQKTIDSGSCGYGDFDPRMYPFYNVVGLHPKNVIVKSLPMAACGSCLEIECTDVKKCHKHAPLQVVITDQCDWDCNATNVNMHVLSFEQLAPTRFGRVNIQYRLVPCEPADPITIHIKDYRHIEGGWIRLAFKNVAANAAINSVEIAKSGSDIHAAGQAADPASPWLPMLNTFGAMWEKSVLPEPPMDIRITNTDGQIVVIQKAVAVAGITGDVETTAQFPSLNAAADGSSSSSNATINPAGIAGDVNVTGGAAPNQPNATASSTAAAAATATAGSNAAGTAANATAAATAGSNVAGTASANAAAAAGAAGSNAAGAAIATASAAASAQSATPQHPKPLAPINAAGAPQPPNNALPGAAAATPAATAALASTAVNASTPNATVIAAAPVDAKNVTVGVALPQPPQNEAAARREGLDLAALAAKLTAIASMNGTNRNADPFYERGNSNSGAGSSSNASAPPATVPANVATVEPVSNSNEPGLPGLDDVVKPATSAGPAAAGDAGAAATSKGGNSKPLPAIGGRRMFV